jgi:hypothetical protein
MKYAENVEVEKTCKENTVVNLGMRWNVQEYF